MPSKSETGFIMLKDKFKTVINWAKEDGNYRGLKYELSNNA